MAAKKGTGKARKSTVKPTVDVRLETLRLFEASAEGVLLQEVQRREREEQEELMMVLREEHDEQIEALERALDAAKRKQLATDASLQAQQREHEKALAAVRVDCDALAVQLETVTSERDDLKATVDRDRQQHIADITKLRTQIKELQTHHEQQRSAMREQVTAANTLVEEHHRSLVTSSESQVASERHNHDVVETLKKELEATLALNRTLQKAVDKAEETDRTNAALQQFLSAQLEEVKRSYESEGGEHKRRLADVQAQNEQLHNKCRDLEQKIDASTTERTQVVEGKTVELRECQQQLEQVKFDAAYLNDQIATTRRDYVTRVAEADARRLEAEIVAQQSVVETEALRAKMAELEALLYRREKEHFGEVTHLRAQIMNTKTALEKVRSVSAASDLAASTGESNSRIEVLRHVYEAREKQLMDDICALRTAVLDMQQHLASKEVELLMSQRANDEQVAQLQNEVEALRATLPVPDAALCR